MKNNVLLIVNPISGDIDKADLIEMTTAFAEKENFNLIPYETSGKNDDSKIKKLYSELSPARVIVAGGDGTIKMVAEILEKENVIFGILPAGSANGLSVDLNLPTTIQENLPIAFLSNYTEMDMISINGKKSLHLSDIGLNADLIKNYENSDIRGKWGYALQAFSTLKEMEEPFEAKIKTNNRTYNFTARMIVIANSQKYGTGVTINPDGVMNDGKFELVVLKSLDFLTVVQIVTGNMPMDNENVEIISTDKAEITTNVPVSFQVDGEYCNKETHLDIIILHKQMKVAIP